MNLIDLMRSATIEGLTIEEFKDVLNYTHPSIRIRNAANGTIVLSNRAIIKCVNNYYTNTNKTAKKPVGVNICHTVHQNLDIQGVSANHCSDCHLNCLSKKDAGQLRLIQKKSFTKRRK